MRGSNRTRSVCGLIGLVGAVALLASGCLSVGPQTKAPVGSYAFGVNGSGLLVGARWTTSPVSTTDHAFSYDTTTATSTLLGGLGGEMSRAHAVNDSGTIVGVATLASGQTRAFRYTTGTGMASIGVLVPAATTPSSSAADVNASGTIVGQSNLETGAVDATHAFVYDPGTATMTDLGTLGGTSSGAAAVNDAGVVVGWSDVAGDASRHAFAYDPATQVMSDLGTFGGTRSWATDVNEHGQVVGSFETGVNAPECLDLPCPLSKVFAYDLGSHTPTVLPLAVGFNSATAAAVNDGGVIVGTATQIGVHCSHCGDAAQATAWELGTTGVYAIDTNQSSAAAISDTGLAVGTTYTFTGGGFPIPIPSGFASQVDQSAGS